MTAGASGVVGNIGSRSISTRSLDGAGWTRTGGFAAQRKTYFAVLMVTLAIFLFLSPFTFGYEHPPWYPKLLFKAFPNWQ